MYILPSQREGRTGHGFLYPQNPWKPIPLPTETHTHDHGYGFLWVRVWVCLSYPGVTHDNPYLQVRSRHLPLNSYLHRIKKVDTNKCQSCKVSPEDDETPPETVAHFINDCDAYTTQRSSLIRAIGSANLSLKNIMTETKYMKELARYIKRTGRFEREA